MIPGVGAVADGLNAVILSGRRRLCQCGNECSCDGTRNRRQYCSGVKGAKVMKGIKGLSKLEKAKFLVKGLKKQGAKAVNALKGVMKEGGTFLKKLNPKEALKTSKARKNMPV